MLWGQKLILGINDATVNWSREGWCYTILCYRTIALLQNYWMLIGREECKKSLINCIQAQ